MPYPQKPSAADLDLSGVPPGNTYNKFKTRHPVERILMKNYKRHLTDLVGSVSVKSVLDVGCGEGYILEHLGVGCAPLVSGADLFPHVVREAKERCPWGRFVTADAAHLPYVSASFDLVLACELLEHVTEPQIVLEELSRIANRYCLLSVPVEPLWRTLNLMRGAYVSALGNTPGHFQHWGRGGFLRFVRTNFHILEVRTPLPWTMVLCEVK